jgi:hypothetical protein
MDFKIAVLAGDGIGPEISVQGVDVMSAVCEKFGHKVSYEYAICGADAIDKVGDPFPEATYQVCKEADAVLFSAVGDPKFDNDPTAKVRPEQGLLARGNEHCVGCPALDTCRYHHEGNALATAARVQLHRFYPVSGLPRRLYGKDERDATR